MILPIKLFYSSQRAHHKSVALFIYTQHPHDHHQAHQNKSQPTYLALHPKTLIHKPSSNLTYGGTTTAATAAAAIVAAAVSKPKSIVVTSGECTITSCHLPPTRVKQKRPLKIQKTFPPLPCRFPVISHHNPVVQDSRLAPSWEPDRGRTHPRRDQDDRNPIWEP